MIITEPQTVRFH